MTAPRKAEECSEAEHRSAEAKPTPGPRLPIGTQVVLRGATVDSDGATVQRGAAGVVAEDTGGAYRVRLSDGRAVLCERSDLTLRRAFQHDQAITSGAPEIDGHALVRQHTIYMAVIGSRAFGLAVEGSDTDLRGTYVAPTPMFWSLTKPPTHVEGPGEEQFSWELERFCELALKANPNLLEVLWSPLVEHITPLGEELLDVRAAFLSQLAYQTYHGYVLSQFKKLEADLRQHGAPKWKHVMHLLRLLLSARTLLRTGTMIVDVGEHRERLLAVRRGEVRWQDVEKWRLSLHHDLDQALARTVLPAVPQVSIVDAWLRDVRARSAREALL